MNILHISNYKANFEGNFINQLKNIKYEVELRGGKVIFIFPDEAQKYEWANVLAKKSCVYFLPTPKIGNFFALLKNLKVICEIENIDIIHSHFDGYDIPAYYASKNKKKVIWHYRNSLDTSRLSKIKKIYAEICIFLKYNIFSPKKRIIFMSESYKSKGINSGKVKEKNSIVIPNGINIDILNLKSINANEIKKQYNIVDKSKTILTFGGDYYRKGIDIVINVYRKLNRDEYNLFIVASEQIEKKIKELHKIEKNEGIIFLRPTHEVINYYSMADIFISASRKETFCNAVAEAAYLGINVISSDIEGLEWAKDIPIVEFFKLDDEKQLIQCIESIKVYNSEKMLESKNKIENEYSNRAWAKKVFDYYNII